MRGPTQKEKVLQILIKDGGWIPTYEFQNHCGIFVGHRGPARISEISIEFPEMIETDRTEKIYKYRFRFDNTHVAFEAYPYIRSFIKEELIKARRLFKEFQTIYDRVTLSDGSEGVRPRIIIANSKL